MCVFYSFLFYSFFGLFINLLYFFMCVFAELDTLKKIVWLEYFKGKQLTIQVPDMQQQNGGNDCGLFAITAATTVCNGVNPASMIFKQSKIHTHLIKAFKDSHLQLFPIHSLKHKSWKKKLRSIITEPLICVCWQPCDCALRVIQCQKCREWFNQTCAQIPSSAIMIQEEEEEWNSMGCANRGSDI